MINRDKLYGLKNAYCYEYVWLTDEFLSHIEALHIMCWTFLAIRLKQVVAFIIWSLLYLIG